MDSSHSSLETPGSQAEDKELGIPGKPQGEHRVSSYEITVWGVKLVLFWDNPKISISYRVSTGLGDKCMDELTSL